MTKALSYTAFNLYITCPYLYYQSKVLHAKATRKIDPKNTIPGLVIHEVFELALYDLMHRPNSTMWRTLIPAVLMKHLAQNKIPFDKPRMARDFKSAVAKLELMAKNLIHILRANFILDEARLEHAIGTYKEPFILACGVPVQGYVDCICKTIQGNLCVLDYKSSGSDKYTSSDQLMMYGLALREQGIPVRGGGFIYFKLNRAQLYGYSDEVLGNFEKRLAEVYQKIMNKEFEARPSKYSCNFCDYNATCKHVFREEAVQTKDLSHVVVTEGSF